MAVLLFFVLCMFGWSNAGWINDWDQKVDFQCPPNQHIYRWKSYHNNRKEDRRWEFFCRPGFVNEQCTWSGDVNNWDDIMDASCPLKTLLTGVKSRHDNRREDRVWQFKCCQRQTKAGTNCKWTPYINNWDGWMDYSLPTGAAIRGVWSVHNNNREDRRYKLLYCTYTTCTAKKMRILDNIQRPKYKNTRIVGLATTQGCSKGPTYTLNLGKTDSVEESSSIEISKGSEFNWETTISVSAEVSAKIFGSGGALTFGLSQSFGGALTWGWSRTKQTTTGWESSAEVSIAFTGPGAALINADVMQYEIDQSSVRAAVDVECDDGTKFSQTSMIKFKTKTFSQTHFNTHIGQFNPGKCDRTTNTCIRSIEGSRVVKPNAVAQAFKNCFRNGVGTATKRK